MARKRMIDPRIWQSEQIATLTRDQRLLFIGMFSNADDEGRLKGSAFSLKLAIFPGDMDITLADIETWRNAIGSACDGNGLAPIRVYSVNGIEYIDFPHWKRYQKIDKPSPSDLPPFPEHSTSDSRTIDEHAPTIPAQEKRKEENRREDSPRAADADAAPSGSAPPKTARPAPKDKGPSIGPIADAFRALGLPNPVFMRGEARAAQDLLKAKYTPEEIAHCWQDHATGEYFADGFSKRDLSFDFLATRNRIGNWRAWVAAGRPAVESRSNGKVSHSVAAALPSAAEATAAWGQ